MRFSLIASTIRPATLALVLASAAVLQSQAPSFDVASVKRNVDGKSESTITPMPNGRLTATNSTLRSLILRAHGLTDPQLIGAPEWIGSERFDIDARLDRPPADGPEALMPMLRVLLAERFGLRTHVEMRELPAYVLVVARGDRRLGPQIRPTQADCSGRTAQTVEEIRASVRDGWPPCGMTFGVAFTTTGPAGNTTKMRLRRSAVAMNDFATALQTTVARPIVDRTRLEGRFDVEYAFGPQAADVGAKSAFGPEAVGLFVALEEQLGLKLESERAEVPVLVVDSVERLTEN